MVVYGVTNGRGYVWYGPDIKRYYPIDPEPSMSYMLIPEFVPPQNYFDCN